MTEKLVKLRTLILFSTNVSQKLKTTNNCEKVSFIKINLICLDK